MEAVGVLVDGRSRDCLGAEPYGSQLLKLDRSPQDVALTRTPSLLPHRGFRPMLSADRCLSVCLSR